jgi:hypothetical protein
MDTTTDINQNNSCIVYKFRSRPPYEGFVFVLIILVILILLIYWLFFTKS